MLIRVASLLSESRIWRRYPKSAYTHVLGSQEPAEYADLLEIDFCGGEVAREAGTELRGGRCRRKEGNSAATWNARRDVRLLVLEAAWIRVCGAKLCTARSEG